jgi:hypothetical protein
MSSYYQFILLGDTGCEACQKVKDRFFELLAERGLDGSIVAVLDGAQTITPLEAGGYDSRKPTFAYYFGKQDHGDKDLEALQKLMGNGDAVFPVFFTEGQFQQEIPAVLHPINGKLYTDGLLDSIVNVAFEELRLLRKIRRVFISYKRSDSAAIANQLYDVLSRHQFDVFLDTYSIRGAADFQAELHHRITDSDVLIQLNSPNFMDSDWCKEEISEANARQVGVLQLNWPEVDSGAANQLCTIRNIKTEFFNNGNQIGDDATLKADVLEDIAMKVEALRARNIAARQDGLTAEFVKEAERQGRAIVKEPMFLVEQRQNGKLWYYIPIIGVPQSMDCYESQEMLKQWLPKDKMPEKVSLIYDDMRILPKWIAHLDWMREYLIVKTIKKQEFELWLKTTK